MHIGTAAPRTAAGGYLPFPGTWDEWVADDGAPRPVAERLEPLLREAGLGDTQARMRRLFTRRGVTFSPGTGLAQADRVFPCDPLPRPVSAAEWRVVEQGAIQRVRALHAYLDDVYTGGCRMVSEGKMPPERVTGCPGYEPARVGFRPIAGVWAHVSGIDLVRGADGVLRVLEDNMQEPSGAMYVVAARAATRRLLPAALESASPRGVEGYSLRLREALLSVAPPTPGREPRLVVLGRGADAPAAYEHAELARGMGCILAEPRDLAVRGGRVHVRTLRGLEPVDVVYRRSSTRMLDPEVREAMLRSEMEGTLTRANAGGNGAADDKAVFAYVPEMIRFYLGEEPILPQVHTLDCAHPEHLDQVLADLPSLVVKHTSKAGGHGIVIGPESTPGQLRALAARIRRDPRYHVAQPWVSLSTSPTWTDGGVVPRRVDLRPYVVTGASGSWVAPGALTRVATRPQSSFVNSSQGGGAKDTWVMGEDRP